jgi:predicted RNA polymerase sigma factor
MKWQQRFSPPIRQWRSGFRGQKKFSRNQRTFFDTKAPADFSARFPAVQRALYVLFNEGYHGASSEFAVRAELCREAIRLTALLLEHPSGAVPSSYALSALMCLNKARLPARLDASGNLTLLSDQDRALWDQQLVSEGLRLLDLSATGSELSGYHVEAAIAAIHATAPSMQETDWAEIVSLYDNLKRFDRRQLWHLTEPSPSGNAMVRSAGSKRFKPSRIRRRLRKYSF